MLTDDGKEQQGEKSQAAGGPRRHPDSLPLHYVSGLQQQIHKLLPPLLFLATASPARPSVRQSARPPQIQAHRRSGIFSASADLRDGACNSLSARPALLGLFYFNPDEKDEDMIKGEGVGVEG